MIARRAAPFILLALTVAVAEPAAAQRRRDRPEQATERDIERARALYADGLHAVDEARWSDALVAFERAYSLSGVAAALYNVATTLRALGRHVEAVDALSQLLETHPELEAPMRVNAETMLREERARVATLILSGLPDAPAPRVVLDGRPVTDPGRRPMELSADPGPHHLLVHADERQPYEWRGALADGGRLRLDVTLAPLPRGESELEILTWVLAIGGAALIAGAIVVGWAVWDADELAPTAPEVIEL